MLVLIRIILIQLVIAIELIGLLRIRKKSLNDEEKNQFSEDLLDNLSKKKKTQSIVAQRIVIKEMLN